MRIVVALGGNALLQRGQPPDSDLQERNVALAVAALAPLARHHELVLTHGNGPQVGVLALESADDRALTRPYPLDALGAETQGLIGYWLLQDLGNALPGREVAVLVTQTVVSADDPAFDAPTKPVGPVYGEAEAHRIAAERGWTIAEDGAWWRRTVPSPAPIDIVEARTIKRLVRAGTVVICAGGGGIPVTRDRDGHLRGIEAVIDKDLTAALLAESLEADCLLLLTDVSAVEVNHGTAHAARIATGTPSELRRHRFAAGSMGPKVEAACRFAEATGRRAAIGALADAAALLTGDAGTSVTPEARIAPEDPTLPWPTSALAPTMKESP